MTKFIMTIGLPGCGKSTWAKEYCKAHENCRWHSSDEIRERLDTKNVNIVFRTMHTEIKEDLAKGCDVIYDATNMSAKRRAATLQEFQKFPCEKTAILFLVPVDECKRRNLLRDPRWQVPNYVYKRMLAVFAPPVAGEGFDRISYIGYNNQYVLPHDARDLNTFQQDNAHHELTLGCHMQKAMEYIDVLATEEKMSEETVGLLKEAAKWHDIGKAYTKKFKDRKGNITEEAHYYDHEHVGSYVYLIDRQRSEHFDFEKALAVSVLIAYHMRPHTAWASSERARQKDRNLLGEEMYENLVRLHKADLVAH